MKRKLDANDIPSPEPTGTEEKDPDFETLGLDPRLRQALIKEKFTKPTLVQAKAIPLALEGKDILGELDFREPDQSCQCMEEKPNSILFSSCKDWLWKDRRLCSPSFAIHSPTKICSSYQICYPRPYANESEIR